MPKSTSTDGGVVRQSASKLKSNVKSETLNRVVGVGSVAEEKVTIPLPVVDFVVVTLPLTMVMDPNAELDPPDDDELADTEALPEPLTDTDALAELEDAEVTAAFAVAGSRNEPPIARALVPRTASRPEGRIALRTCFISSSCE
jgi:hypothetical protein